MKILVTGGAGFIGSEFVRQGIRKKCKIVVIDKLTYAGDLRRLTTVKGKYKFYKHDICDCRKITQAFRLEKPDIVVHFAAESHVDRSIVDPTPFIQTNVAGTQNILDCSYKFHIKKFVHISTDEVYGEIAKGKFTESSAFQPNSPYSVSKAAADMLARAYYRTFGLPVIVVRPCNNYGPWQFPEKLIPVIINKIRRGEKVPVYGAGQNIREWLFVADCVKAIWSVLSAGRIGQVYNIGSGVERKNLDVVKMILSLMNQPEDRIEFVRDRPGHDLRYSLDSSKVNRDTGWQAKIGISDGLRRTVAWYSQNNY